MQCDSRFQAPVIAGWHHVTNSDAPTALAAEAEYRDTVTRIMARRGREPGAFAVRVESFHVDGDPVNFAVYRQISKT